MTDPQDSYHAHQAFRQVYVVIRVDEGSGPLSGRFTVSKILRSYEAAKREVEKLNATGAGLHVWQVARLAPDDGPAPEPAPGDPAAEVTRLKAERDSLAEELRRIRGS